jgi:hypothetical protein
VNFGRNPILLIIALFFLLFIVLSVINRKSSTSLNDTDRAVRTEQALTRVVNAEAKYFASNKKYAPHIADLVPLAPKLGVDLTDGIVSINLDSSGDKAYVVQVGSTVVSFTRAFFDGKPVKGAWSCLQLKSAGKKYCLRTTDKIKKSLPAT